MSDLIRREDAVEALYQALRTTLAGTFTDSMSLAIAMANNLPSAEPERKKGKWIDEKPNMYTRKVYCSECGCMALSKVKSEGDVYNPRYNIEFVKSNFCPNCGANMRGNDGTNKN